ncbi:MAG: aminotransferase class I/II-fold pyridoxal phosphate-dependent enzyme [Sphingobacteriaceae bacterium]
MIIHNFINDYSEGCHPSILEALTKSNLEQQAGYGNDSYTQSTTETIRKKTGNPSVDIHLVTGGTLANLLVLGAILKPFESVIAADTGHINTHEAGAIEATGHKVESVPTRDGKLRISDIEPVLVKFPEFHTVKPRVIYISNSTEIGTIYTKQELTQLSNFCKANKLLLFLDGARLAMALTAHDNDVSLADISSLTDVFYIGGTKVGALLGEAIVIANEGLKKDFKYHMKQRGALMAKGRTLGIQFDQLLKDDLIFQLAQHANAMAIKISQAINDLGYTFLAQSSTNQVFPILPNSLIHQLQERYGFLIWKQVDDKHAAIRLITSWATPEEKVDQFIIDLRRFSKD